MGKQSIYAVLVIYLAFVNIALTQGFSDIIDCYYYRSNNQITFVCSGHHNRYARIFSNEDSYCINDYNTEASKKSIDSVNFKDCVQPKISETMFQYYINLRSLDLSFLALETEQIVFLAKPNVVMNIDASHNHIDSLSNGMLSKSGQLMEIDFSFNSLKHFDSDAFSEENSVKFLNLAFNNISELAVKSLHRLNRMERLLISHNQINELPSFLFHKTKNLAELDLSVNNISKIYDYAFHGDLNLEKLNLSHNHIRALAQKLFENHSNLTHLDVSWNEIAIVKPNTFAFQQKLVYLDISQNAITKWDKLEGMEKLEHLNLSWNKLCEIKLGTFSTFKDLQMLDLSGNQLKVLDVNILPSPPSNHKLKFLYIANNQIEHLRGFTNSTIPNGVIVGIDSNKINCTHFDHILNILTVKHFDSFETQINCDSYSEHEHIDLPSSTEHWPSAIQTTTIETVSEKVQENHHTKMRENLHSTSTNSGHEHEMQKLKRDDNGYSAVKNTVIVDHNKSGIEKHLVVMVWFIAICLVVIIVGASILVWFGLRWKQKLAYSQPIQVIYRQPIEATPEEFTCLNELEKLHSQN